MKSYNMCKSKKYRALIPWQYQPIVTTCDILSAFAWNVNEMHKYMIQALSPLCIDSLYKSFQNLDAFLLQYAEIQPSPKELFLTGTGGSGLTAILPSMERKVRGELC